MVEIIRYHQQAMGRNERIVDELRTLGVRSGEVLMVHASLRAVGALRVGGTGAALDGGADGLLDALRDGIGPHGTLFMNIGADDDWSWVNATPPDDRGALLADAVPFDPLITPAEKDNGVLAEVFRRRPGTLVSNHPEGRFAANGPLAERLVADVPWDDYYGVDSPLDRFARVGGRVLRLGADPDTVTLIHLAENLVDLPWKRRVVRHRLVATPYGPMVRTVHSIDDSDGIVEWPGEDYFVTVLREYLATGRAARGLVGQADSDLIDGTDLVGFATVWLRDHLVELSIAAAREITKDPTRDGY